MNVALRIRQANKEDLPDIVRLLADDPIGSQREDISIPLAESYLAAFEAIHNDPNNELVVAVSDDSIVAVLQLTFIPNITYRGSWRALVEGVRVDRSFRSHGIGKQMLVWSIERSRQRGCQLVQLTSGKQRQEAIRFYEQLGFVASHEGFKLHLNKSM